MWGSKKEYGKKQEQILKAGAPGHLFLISKISFPENNIWTHDKIHFFGTKTSC